MFNRYWRTYPWVLQLTLAFLMIFTLMSFAIYLTLVLVPKLTGVSVNDLIQLSEHSPVRTVRISLIAQAINQIGTFVAPALIFATFTHPRVREYLGLRLTPKSIHWLFVTGIMLGLIPVLLWGESWMMKHLHLGVQADEMQHKTDGIFKAYLNLRSGSDFILLLSILALLPAIGEELAFRGIFLRLFHRGFNRRSSPTDIAKVPDIHRTMMVPVIGSALLFAYWHSSPYGFVFIFIAGCMLALIYHLTGSLLCSMWAHFLYNGIQVIAVFLSQYNDAARKVVEGDHLPVFYPLAGLVIFAVSFYALVRTQTPLPANWSTDFKPGEEQ